MSTAQPPQSAQVDPQGKPGQGTGPEGTGGPGAPGPRRSGPGVVKRTANTITRILLVVIGALIALFAVLNRQDVEVDWIFGDPIQTPLILAIAVTLLAGITIGWLLAKLGGRK